MTKRDIIEIQMKITPKTNVLPNYFSLEREVNDFAEKLSRIEEAHVWFICPRYIQIGNYQGDSLLGRSTNLEQKNQWMIIKRDTKFLYDVYIIDFLARKEYGSQATEVFVELSKICKSKNVSVEMFVKGTLPETGQKMLGIIAKRSKRTKK